ncbi:pirin family protein [Acidothermaceae bacterium B102]|nr:pirin family protein [Acidothermaceae bacterium B102]
MPAITPDDLLVLPRIARSAPGTTQRPVLTTVQGRETFEGEGFPVRRPFPGKLALSVTDPFLLLDQMGAVEYAPGEPKGTPWHPHRGFETVTYIIDGAFQHQDSTGGGGLIADGATQWMTAGSGLLHIETPPERLVASGGLFHGVQLWVNLPASLKWTPPRYQDIAASSVSLLASEDGGALVRVIAGSLAGHDGPGITWTPITYAHATISPGAQLDVPWNKDFNALVYVLSGRGSVGVDKAPVRTGSLAVLGEGDALTVAADLEQDASSPSLEVLLLGGQPLREPIVHHGPFVMNSHTEIAQAIDDFKAGRMGQVPATRVGV